MDESMSNVQEQIKGAALFQQGQEQYKQILEDLSQNYRIGGKTMKEWATFFKIEIPPDPTPAEVRQLLSHLNKLYQLADHYLRLARAAHQAAALNYKIAKGAAVQRVLSEWAGSRPPSRETAEQVAVAECAELHATLVNAEVQASFWEELIWQLKNQLEILTTIQRSQTTETRIGGAA